jgi:putative ABC transport system substrate-binding protein
MRRRKFIALLGGATAAWPLAARSQPGKSPTVVVLGDVASVWSSWTAAFAERLHELGWIEGRTVGIEYRWSEGRPERVAEFAAEFVQQKVDVIVTYGGAVTILKQATTSIPIVFALAVDPLGIGLVANLSRPGGNVTGLSMRQAEIASKRLALLREVVPGLRRLAIMFDSGYPASVREIANVQAAARTLGLEVTQHEIRRAEDIASVFDAIKGQTGALYVVENALMSANADHIIALALNANLPTTFTTGYPARAGALMSYGPNVPALFRHAADYVDKILHGMKPGDLPVEQPTQFDFVINLKTAKALGLTVPHNLLVLVQRAAELRLPTIYEWPEAAHEGGFIAYGSSLVQVYRELMALQLAKLLRGAKPAEMPVLQPTNMKTAKALGLIIPESFLVRADEVIE